ncbi:leucine-rich repeat domain-containing protein [Fulvivirga maritima]|uniref:leucine-rich repeat domain-containing protein n=1 Tax=Fulvivirga maritima TaxID=2904247 RepID=UPI001F1D13CA|nr:leucine-rich repeat domain-containing protein [Fulvivirga maritima]UII25881.1 leucine-rich repeat domain-containing protein [Fulvivirga maritima]
MSSLKGYIEITPDTLESTLTQDSYDHIIVVTVIDLDGIWSDGLPEGILSRFPNVEGLKLFVKNLSYLPKELPTCKKLKTLILRKSKITNIPILPSLESIEFDSGASQKIGPIIKNLNEQPQLKSLSLGDHYGKAVPKELSKLDNISTLVLGYDYFKKRELSQLVAVAAEMNNLKVLKIETWRIQEQIDKSILQLDHLEVLDLRLYEPLQSLSPYIAGFEHCKLHSGLEKIDKFFEEIETYQLSQDQKVMAFAWYTDNYNALDTLQKFDFNTQQASKIRVCLSNSIKGWTKKSITEKLMGVGWELSSSLEDSDLAVVSNKTKLEEFVSILKGGFQFVTESAFKEFLETSQNKWLLDEAVEPEVEGNVYRLLASYDPDNLRLAFEIVSGGGINKEVLSMIAAIALSHPDKQLSKEAEKLYVTRASDSLFQTLKKDRGVSLRRSSNTARKVNILANVADVDFPAFVLMHHVIAGNNPQIRDVQLGYLDLKPSVSTTVSPLIVYFDQIKSINLDTRKDFDYESLAQVLPKLTLESLSMANCHFTIGEEIGKQTHLKKLVLSYNKLKDTVDLSGLSQLKNLHLAGVEGISQFNFLKGLSNLQELNLDALKLQEMPEEIDALTNLRILSIKKNKIKKVAGKLSQNMLREIDLSTNKLEEFPELACLNHLQKLNLRSNSISNFSIKESPFLGKYELALRELNLGKNKLKEISFEGMNMPNLFNLNIESNQISKIDRSVIEQTQITELQASKNNLNEIPRALSARMRYRKLNLAHNNIQVLPQWFAAIHVDNCQLNNNEINEVHPDFNNQPVEKYARLYWNVKNNPFKPETNPYGDIYW